MGSNRAIGQQDHLTGVLEESARETLLLRSDDEDLALRGCYCLAHTLRTAQRIKATARHTSHVTECGRNRGDLNLVRCLFSAVASANEQNSMCRVAG